MALILYHGVTNIETNIENNKENTKENTELCLDSKIFKKKIGIVKSLLIMEIIGCDAEEIKNYLWVNQYKLETTTMVIECNTHLISGKENKIRTIPYYKQVNIPKYLLTFLFKKNLLQNTNKYLDMCLTVNKMIVKYPQNKLYREEMKDILLIKKIIEIISESDEEFVERIDHDNFESIYKKIYPSVTHKNI